VEEKNLTLSGDYRETLQMAPYSVTLIRLTGENEMQCKLCETQVERPRYRLDGFTVMAVWLRLVFIDLEPTRKNYGVPMAPVFPGTAPPITSRISSPILTKGGRTARSRTLRTG